MRRTAFVLWVVVAWAMLACAAEQKHTTDSLETVRKNLVDEKAVLLDVREPAEWNVGHLAEAVLVPLSELNKQRDAPEYVEELAKKVDKKKIIYCHCRSGGRVIPASEFLGALGYEVRPLKWGYQDLLEAGFEKADDKDD